MKLTAAKRRNLKSSEFRNRRDRTENARQLHRLKVTEPKYFRNFF